MPVLSAGSCWMILNLAFERISTLSEDRLSALRHWVLGCCINTIGLLLGTISLTRTTDRTQPDVHSGLLGDTQECEVIMWLRHIYKTRMSRSDKMREMTGQSSLARISTVSYN